MGLLFLSLLSTSFSALHAAELPRVNDERLEIVQFAASPEIVHPIALDFDSSGRLLVVESHTHFRPPNYQGPAHDRIRIIEDTDGVTASWYHHDQLGTTRTLTDNAGDTLATYSYDPYGNPAGATGTDTTPFGYTGQYTDTETGLIYLRARYYDPATAQFLTRDPLEILTGEPYSYAADNPLNMADPSGLASHYSNKFKGWLLDLDAATFSAIDKFKSLAANTWGGGGAPPTSPKSAWYSEPARETGEPPATAIVSPACQPFGTFRTSPTSPTATATTSCFG